MRRIGVVTVARSDYGIYRSVLRALESAPDVELSLYVTGMHLSPEFGETVRDIERDGYRIAERIEMLLSSDTPGGLGQSIGLGVLGFSQAFARERPDILVVLGDRFEMMAAALAALPFTLPVAHIHGGEVTEGALDECFRHAITKLSHLHFASTGEHADRIRQLGEESWRVHVSGAPSLDGLRDMPLLTRAELEAQFGLRLPESPLLVTFHPVTTEFEQTPSQIRDLLSALVGWSHPIVFTLPNADTAGRRIMAAIEAFVDGHPDAQLVRHFGTLGYFSMMRHAAAMIGNSSSGLLEAPSFGLPVVNVGTRQQGRTRGANVIDVGYASEEIRRGIARALDPAFRSSLAQAPNPYHGDVPAADIIARELRQVALDQLIPKRFADLANHH